MFGRVQILGRIKIYDMILITKAFVCVFLPQMAEFRPFCTNYERIFYKNLTLTY